MTSSASVSSSLVVTPGATASLMAARASATTSPARRMSSSCSGDLISMSSRRRNTVPLPVGAAQSVRPALSAGPALSVEAAQHGQDPGGDAVHRAGGLDPLEQPVLGVEPD